MGNRTTVYVSSQIVVSCLSPGARGGQAGWPLATVTEGLPDGAVLDGASVTDKGDLRLVFEVPGAEDVAEQTVVRLAVDRDAQQG